MEEFRLAALLLMMGNDLCHAEKQGRERNLPSSIDADYLSN
jgi:hypothetical protein